MSTLSRILTPYGRAQPVFGQSLGLAVGAGHPKHVAFAVAIGPPRQDEQQVGEAVEVAQHLGIDRLFRYQRRDRALGTAGHGAGQV